MSLINDALKRARDAQPHPPAEHAPDPQIQPIEPAREARHGLGLLLPAGLCVVALFGLFWVWQAVQGRSSSRGSAPKAQAEAKMGSEPMPPAAPAQAARAPAVSVPAPEPSPPAAQTPPAPSIPAQHSDALSNTAAATAPAASVAGASTAVDKAASNAPALTEPVPAPPAPLKLQAIVFNPPQPSAIINGKTLYVGDHIREFQVLAISKASATLADGGHTNVLRLSD